MLKIFILEDNKDRIKWFKKTFKGCKLYVTKDVDKALSILMSNKFDAIFLDHDLDEFDISKTGRELTRQMKKKRIASLTPVVLHTKNPLGRRKMARHLLKYKQKQYIHYVIYSELKNYTADMIYTMIGISKAKKKKIIKVKKN